MGNLSISLPPLLLGGTVPPSGGASTTVGVPRDDWWEKWWNPADAAPDTAQLQAIFGKDFDASTSLRTYITTSGQPPDVILAAFQLTAPVGKGAPDVYTVLTKAGWLLDASLPLQQRDPTYALSVLLKNATLRTMALQWIPVRALFFRVSDAVAKEAATFRPKIPRCAGLSIAKKPNVGVTQAAAKAAKSKADGAAAKAAKSPDDDAAQASAASAAYLAQVADDNATAAAASSQALTNKAKADQALAKAQKDYKKNPSADAQGAVDDTTDDANDAGKVVDDLANTNLIGGWMFMGNKAPAEPPPPDSATMAEKRMYWAEQKLFREGAWNAINAYDGTFTYGSGWNMTSGEGGAICVGLANPRKVVLRPTDAADQDYVDSFTVGCKNTLIYLKKCGIWFDQTTVRPAGMTQTTMRLLHIDTDSGAGYIIDNAQLCRLDNLGLGGLAKTMGSAYKYLAMSRTLVEAFISGGNPTLAKLPDEPAYADGECMPSAKVMQTIQLRLFEVNRTRQFAWSAACSRQATYFLLIHANHFGQAYAPDAIIQFGISSKLIPAVTSEKSPGPDYVKLSTNLWLLPSPATDVKIARAVMTYMTTYAYNSKKRTTHHVNYTWPPKSKDDSATYAYFDMWSKFVADMTTPHAGLGEPAYTADAAPASAPGSTPPPFPAPLNPDDPEPLPLRPWRQSFEGAVPPDAKDPKAALDDAASAAEDWVTILGTTLDGWEAVHYVLIPKAAAPS